MPRGKTAAKPKAKATTTTTRTKSSTSEEEPPKKRATRSTRGKAMASVENKVSVGSKRKQKASKDVNQQEESTAPAPKKQKATTSRSTEDTDRAVFVHKEPPKPEPVVEKMETTADKISHPSHKHESGEVMTFGQGDIGQLGLGEEVDERKKPSPVRGELEGKRVVQVICGGMHTVALTKDGKVYTWGCNDESALGRPTADGEEFTPGLVRALEDVMVVQVSAGDCHTAALTDAGVVYCWGVFRDSNGPFGLLKPGQPCASPVVAYESEQKRAVKVVSGSDHVIILTTDGDIYSFGCAEQGQLGRVPECFSTRGGRKGPEYLLQPQIVRFRKSRGAKPKFTDVFCGSYTTFAYTDTHHLYSWGLNNYGQLGVDDDKLRFVPEQLSEDWKETGEDTDSSRKKESGLEAAGGQHHSLLCHRGCVFVMGRREYGRLGLGEKNTKEPLVPTVLPKLTNISSVAAGSVCSFAVSRSGEVYSWGMGTSLQLGNGVEDDIWEPTVITGKKIENRKVIGASSGGQHTALLVSLPEDC